MKLSQADLDFLLFQLNLPGNNPLNAPLGTITDPTGIRDVQGIGNNLLNPTWGAADQQFVRATPIYWAQAEGSFDAVTRARVETPISYATRDINIYDSKPRTISNLIANQDDASLSAIGYAPNELKLIVMDNPDLSPTGRLSPLTGNVNPLPYSGLFTIFEMNDVCEAFQ